MRGIPLAQLDVEGELTTPTGAAIVAALADEVRRRGSLFHTDAVQAAGRVPVDAAAWGVDLLSVSAHKMHGPKGAGALYVRRGVPLSPLTPGGGQEKRLRAGTENPISCAADESLGTRSSISVALLEHFPEKWTPVFRRKCDHVRNLERVSDST